MITALDAHHSQIAWIEKISRYVKYALKPKPVSVRPSVAKRACSRSGASRLERTAM